MSTRQTTEQRRAASAWQNIEEVDGQSDAFKKKYGSWARKLPALIQTNGLGQALAFLYAKGAAGSQQSKAEKHQAMLYRHLSEWVRAEVKQSGADDKDLLQRILQHNSGHYRRAATEAIAYAMWLRRFAEAKDWGGDELEED